MPKRITPLVTDQYYHIFNRSINKEPIFVNTSDCNRAFTTLNYYKVKNPPIRLSYFLALGVDRRQEIVKSILTEGDKLVELIAFCLMPNHFHFLLKQTAENGTSIFLARFQNSYTRYFNTKHARQGHVFQGQFKAVRIEDEEQLLHVHRYIHLNPYTSYVVKTFEELEHYFYSSLPEYLGESSSEICTKDIILSQFRTRKAYKKFIFDQAKYQRKLDKIKHLILE